MNIPRYSGNRPGFVHDRHLQFLDGIRRAVEYGKDPLPYLQAEFRELDERTAQKIIDWWRSQWNQ